jgi:hypothetical protein
MAPAQHAHPAHDRRQWRPELVGQDGQELILGGVGALRLGASRALRFVKPRQLDHERDPVGDEVQEPQIIGRELVRRRSADMDDANQALAHPERRAHDRFDAFAKERAHHVDPGQIVEDQALLAGGDPAGDTASHRDLEVLVHFFA